MAVAKIFIGYRTRLVPGIEKTLPEFKAPANYKDPAKIEADIRERKEAFLAGAKDMPYTGTFDEVYMIDQKNRKPLLYSSQASDAGEKPPVAVRVRNYLDKHFPNAWGNDGVIRKGPPKAIVIGFDPRTFLKMLGLECSLPSVGKPCKLGLWYSNTDHRDITEAVLPKDFKGLTLPYALKFRRPVDGETAKKWDDWMADWPGPGVFPEKDAKIACELAYQLGFLDDDELPAE